MTQNRSARMTFSGPPVKVRTMRARKTAAMMRIPAQAKIVSYI